MTTLQSTKYCKFRCYVGCLTILKSFRLSRRDDFRNYFRHLGPLNCHEYSIILLSCDVLLLTSFTRTFSREILRSVRQSLCPQHRGRRNTHVYFLDNLQMTFVWFGSRGNDDALGHRCIPWRSCGGTPWPSLSLKYGALLVKPKFRLWAERASNGVPVASPLGVSSWRSDILSVVSCSPSPTMSAAARWMRGLGTDVKVRAAGPEIFYVVGCLLCPLGP